MIALFISFEFKVIRVQVTLHRIHVTVPSFPSTPKSPQQGWNFANTITETFEKMMSRNSQTLTIVASPTLVQLSKVRWTLEIRDVSIFMFFFFPLQQMFVFYNMCLQQSQIFVQCQTVCFRLCWCASWRGRFSCVRPKLRASTRPS